MHSIPTFYMGGDPGNRTSIVARRDSDGKNEVVKTFPSFRGWAVLVVA